MFCAYFLFIVGISVIFRNFIIPVDTAIALPHESLRCTITREGLYDFVEVGLEPSIDYDAESLQIPDQSIPFTMGITKGVIDFKNFNVESFTFFEDDETLIAISGADNSLLLDLYDAGVIISVDYKFKLTTFPYTETSGSAVISVEGLDFQVSLTVEVVPDDTDQSCFDNDSLPSIEEILAMNQDDDEYCGYNVSITLKTFVVNIEYFDIQYIGDVNPMIEALTTILSDTLVVIFDEVISTYAVDLINASLVHSASPSEYLYNNSETYFELAGSPTIKFTDTYAVVPFASAHTQRVNGTYDNPNKYLAPFMLEDDPMIYPTFPDVIAGNDINLFVGAGIIDNAFYQQLVNNRSHWESMNVFTGTKTKTACASERNGCGASGEYERISSSSVIFESSSYAVFNIPELNSCDGCDLEVDWLLADPNVDPVVPYIESFEVDGFVLVYEDLNVNIRGVDSDGNKFFEIPFITTLEFKGIIISDHVFVNIMQGFQSVREISYSGTGDPSMLDAWTHILAITSSGYLQPFISNYFEQRFAWFVNLPVGNFFSCSFKNEELYYSPEGKYLTLTMDIDMCNCDRSCWKDGSCRNDARELTCIQS
ncbi:hypothetical protein ADUPG1_013730 [Aduncisulcus paluster]|uniref:Uncharacterized protein n=1 Tax=Aduncisulcus paluster TaxID=2918883 RepID=A0ABQ5K3Z3_9EUKA|nr:hypothetical protein ADUPG1_013730 [Aduncisulcus paluster]